MCSTAAVLLAGTGGCTSVQSESAGEVSAIPSSAVSAYSAAPPAESTPAVQPPPRPAAPASAAQGWSGESGASGHPQMTAAAIRTAAAEFPQCLERLWPQAARRGVSRATFDRHTRGLEPDLRIMDFMDAQPEFTRAVWDYLDMLVSEARIQRGREMLTAHRATFDAVERAYGVDRHFIAAIWGVETNYGDISGSRSVVRSTATLACIGRRQDYFRDEFVASLQILQRGDLTPEQLVGSWAGAFGNTQFMPTTFLRHAVDFNGDGRRDVVGSIPDVVASTANKLKRTGWTSGQTWGYEVVLPSGFDYGLADRSRELSLAEWQRMGVRRAGGQDFARPRDNAFLLLPAGARGPAFLMLGNFRAIMRYNPAEAYALAIGHLADRLRGGEPFVQSWPRDEQVLSRSDRLELQRRLAARGFDIGQPDGRLGPRTRAALRSFQASAGLPADGFPSATVLARLRQ
jgi:membrane-bound lytic murein transglycosylase B